MPLNKLAQSLTGTCRHCGQKTGILQRIHPECRRTHQAGIQEMTQLATQAAAAHTFNETALRQTLGAIAQRSRATGPTLTKGTGPLCHLLNPQTIHINVQQESH